MKASRLVEVINAAIVQHGDLDIVVAYDGSHADIAESGYPNDGFGPRVLHVVPKGMPTTELREVVSEGEVYKGPVVFEL